MSGRIRGDQATASTKVPWQTRVRAVANRVGLDLRPARRLRWLHKAMAVRRSQAGIRRNLGFVLWSPEPDNFTYDIVNHARAGRVGRRRRVLRRGAGPALSGRARGRPAGDAPPAGRHHGPLAVDQIPAAVRQAAWLVRARARARPKLIIEVGAHDGLGAFLLLRSLERNGEEGYPGRLVSFDVNPKAGWLVGHHPLWDLRTESSQSGLPALIGAGRHHRHVHLRRLALLRSRTRRPRARRRPRYRDGILLSDDAQVTHALADVCRDRTLAYFEFHEVPREHFYPGGFSRCGPSTRPRPQHQGRGPGGKRMTIGPTVTL